MKLINLLLDKNDNSNIKIFIKTIEVLYLNIYEEIMKKAY
ncbi:hypothetical protein DDB_G0275187 [Dictyostelium discoideum AX4]|uniref:Uncharacterized protein n=1 Tax=Dictyostelium discoideum TaxID=44689 RepID=Q553X5_DICDI|nr:hypothetical protein DDB_G0275187 [Dictyostelium discoideum AX4]EAL69874.1 hypothetical protein DDB_G0275187 [Dictyostelium discoideum AX4]|eukprot:XP_643836.1 hypothetical protein DDB_G0275187 [Dictyostelium discoideum AX4]